MAFLRDTSGPQPFLRAPAVVLWLIFVLLAAHALRVFAFPEDTNQLLLTYGLVPARYSHAWLDSHGMNPGTLVERLLPFVTYMFLHGSWTHVVINSVWLLAFGPVVARRFGSMLFIAFFLVCGIGGALAHLACNWGDSSPAIGASGAISGLMAASFRMLPTSTDGSWQPLESIFAPRILIWTLIWVILNTVAGVTGLGTGSSEVQLVAWQAHLGGYVAGLILAGVFDALAGRRAAFPTEA
ncbi:MAG TPA: rhomboid family intramembrane serine protease [Rhizomicrobium sp.]